MKAAKTFWLSVPLLLILPYFGGTDIGKSHPLATAFNNLAASRQNALPDPNIKWMAIVNSRSTSLPELYTKDAYVITADGNLIQGDNALLDHYQNQAYEVENIAVKKRITAVYDSTIVYEQGNFNTSGMNKYAHLIIWKKENGQMLRELEMVVEEHPETPHAILERLDERRKEWIRLCNLHDTANLVNHMYSENTMYYNHRPMLIGRNAVIREYQYMSRPNYKLHLTPIEVQLVNRKIAFEIGKCSGSYNGNYVLVWKKDSDGVWRILLDSNI